jgi:hypothetical protein
VSVLGPGQQSRAQRAARSAELTPLCAGAAAVATAATNLVVWDVAVAVAEGDEVRCEREGPSKDRKHTYSSC